jgi:hypothetical protein
MGRGGQGRGGGMLRTTTYSNKASTHFTIKSTTSYASTNTISNKTNTYSTPNTVTNTTNNNESSSTLQSNNITKTKVFNHIFCIHVRAKTVKETDVVTKEKVIEHVLQSLRKSDPNLLLLTPPSQIYTQLSTNAIYNTNNALISNHQRYSANLGINKKKYNKWKHMVYARHHIFNN